MAIDLITLPESPAQWANKLNETINAVNIVDVTLSDLIATSTHPNKLDGTSAPDANDDSANTGSNGAFEVGSFWLDTTTSPNEAYRCMDATPTAAVWLNTTVEVGDLGALAVLDSLDADDISDAATTNKFVTAADITTLGNTSGTNSGDMSDADVKTAYENNADTNAFNDAAVTKLGGIEALADVTDTTNVTAAGAAILSSDNTFSSTGFLDLPSGTTAERPGVPVNGMLRYNDTTNKFEGYENGLWVNLI